MVVLRLPVVGCVPLGVRVCRQWGIGRRIGIDRGHGGGAWAGDVGGGEVLGGVTLTSGHVGVAPRLLCAAGF